MSKQLDLAREQLALLDHVLDRVARERLERGPDVRAQGLVSREDLRRVQTLAVRDGLAGAADRPVVLNLDEVPITEGIEEVLAHDLDERDARLREQQRAHVRIGPGGRHRAVDHRGDTAAHEVLAGHAVEIAVVDDGDLPGLEALHQVLGAPA